MDQPWRIELFGWLRGVQAERVISRFRTRKAGALLAYLAYHSHRSHPRELLIELLWPECETAAGRANLRAELTSLRHQLEPPGVPPGVVLVACRDTIQLNPAASVTDVALFEAAVNAAERAPSPAERTQQLLSAAELYRGELLPGSFEEWVLRERQRLAEAHLHALHTLVTLLEEQGDWPRALQWARRAVAADPLHEESHQLLIRLLVAAGQIEAARAQYEQGQQLLLQELGAGLSPEIHALVRDLAPSKEWPPPGAAGQRGKPRRRRTPTQAPELPVAAPEASPTLVAAACSIDNLPLRFTRFFGREREIAGLGSLLGSPPAALETQRAPRKAEGAEEPSDPDVVPLRDLCVSSAAGGEYPRLVTLTGPGGTGKTRLAQQAIRGLRNAFPGGVWFVSLQELVEPPLIPDQILLALRQPRLPHQVPLEQVVAFLSRAPALLVLDNFEHLVEGGAEMVQRLREQVEHLTVLVTSRRRLGLEGEREFPVGPLPMPGVQALRPSGLREGAIPSFEHLNARTPEGLNALTQFPSIALFVDRAQAARPDFQVTVHNAAAVAELCRQLEGLPLAIELAAARAGVLTPQQMLSRLSERFELLISRQRVADQRHGSLRTTLDWSYQLLSPELQQFFARLSVFRGGWTLEAAEAVCEAPLALDCLEQLRQCSMVLAEETAAGSAPGAGVSRDAVGGALSPASEMRFRLLETLRAYGAEQLTAREQAGLAERHAAYYQGLPDAAAARLEGTSGREWLDCLEREHDNLRAALAWCQSAAAGAEMGLRLSRSMAWFWDLRGYWAEGRRWMEGALAHPGAQSRTIERGSAIHQAGCLIAYCNCNGDYEAARPLLEESLAIAEELGDKPLLIGSLLDLASLAIGRADLDAAQVFNDRTLALSRETDDRSAIAEGLSNGADIARRRGEVGKARSLLDESIAIARELGGRLNMSVCLDRIDLALAEGDQSTAQSLGWEALAQARELGYRSALERLLQRLGAIELSRGEYAAARALLRESLSMFSELGEQHSIPVGLEKLAELAAEDEPTCAACLWGAAEALREALGSALPALPSARAEYERQVAGARVTAGDEAFAAAWAAGRAMELELATTYALSMPSEKPDA